MNTLFFAECQDARDYLARVIDSVFGVKIHAVKIEVVKGFTQNSLQELAIIKQAIETIYSNANKLAIEDFLDNENNFYIVDFLKCAASNEDKNHCFEYGEQLASFFGVRFLGNNAEPKMLNVAIDFYVESFIVDEKTIIARIDPQSFELGTIGLDDDQAKTIIARSMARDIEEGLLLSASWRHVVYTFNSVDLYDDLEDALEGIFNFWRV